jgi:hypothetical protein
MRAAFGELLRSRLRVAGLAYAGAGALVVAALIGLLIVTPTGLQVQEVIWAPLAPLLGVSSEALPTVVRGPESGMLLPDAPLQAPPLIGVPRSAEVGTEGTVDEDQPAAAPGLPLELVALLEIAEQLEEESIPQNVPAEQGQAEMVAEPPGAISAADPGSGSAIEPVVSPEPGVILSTPTAGPSLPESSAPAENSFTPTRGRTPRTGGDLSSAGPTSQITVSATPVRQSPVAMSTLRALVMPTQVPPTSTPAAVLALAPSVPTIVGTSIAAESQVEPPAVAIGTAIVSGPAPAGPPPRLPDPVPNGCPSPVQAAACSTMSPTRSTPPPTLTLRGDSHGRSPSATATSRATPAPPQPVATKVGVCHSTGSSTQPTVYLEVDSHALAAHLAHGDRVAISRESCLGAGPAGASAPTPTRERRGQSGR